MSCGCTPSPVNPARPGEPGAWVLPRRSPTRSDGCTHTYAYRNAADIIGGPIVKVCTGCGHTIDPTWVPAVVRRPALPAPEAFLVGEAEWLKATHATPRGAA